jgi:thiamine pyrophosphokinase
METCYIVGAGECPALSFAPTEADLVIAADGGFAYLRRDHIRTDLALGDFDSLGQVPDFGATRVYPVRKDDTDMMLAVKTGLHRGFRRFELYGGMGGQLEHTLANIQTLQYLHDHGARGFLTDGAVTLTVMSGTGRFCPDASGSVSVFAMAGEAVVTLKHLLYETDNAVFSPGFPLGVSNKFTGRSAEIDVSAGSVVLLWYGPPQWFSAT